MHAGVSINTVASLTKSQHSGEKEHLELCPGAFDINNLKFLLAASTYESNLKILELLSTVKLKLRLNSQSSSNPLAVPQKCLYNSCVL